jgi:hypothetical protein
MRIPERLLLAGLFFSLIVYTQSAYGEHANALSQATVLRLRGGMSYFQGADFKEVIIRGGSAPKKPEASQSKPTGAAQKPRKDDDGPVQEMPHELKIAIMKARQAKNMTQKQLAQALNIQVQVSHAQS